MKMIKRIYTLFVSVDAFANGMQWAEILLQLQVAHTITTIVNAIDNVRISFKRTAIYSDSISFTIMFAKR